jgi:hypothetical protein
VGWVGSLDQLIEFCAQQVVIGAILFSLFWLVVGWKDSRQLRQSLRHHWWRAIFDFAVPLYLLMVILLNKWCGISLGWLTIAHGTVLAMGLQVIGGLSTRIIMEDFSGAGGGDNEHTSFR